MNLAKKAKHFKTLAAVYKNYILQKEVCTQMPNRIWIEPTSVCNLECVMCPQSMEREFSKGFMELELYRRLIDEVKHYAHDVNLFHRGESTAHPKLAEMIAYAKEAGLNTRLHTNGTLLNLKKSEELIRAGLDYVSFSFDGYDSESYEKTRVKGKYPKTLENVKEFLRLKAKWGNGTPYTIIQTMEIGLKPDQNKMELREQFRREFDGLPIDRFTVRIPHNWSGDWQKGWGLDDDYTPCTFLWYALIVCWDGKVMPCPQDFYNRIEVGDATKNSLAEIWNGPRMREMRRQMKSREALQLEPCNTCDILHRKTFMGVPVNYLKVFLKENVFASPYKSQTAPR